MLISLVAQNKCSIHHMDVKSAFLNEYLEEVVYMGQPKGMKFKENKIMFTS
jgi:hypothetical protein